MTNLCCGVVEFDKLMDYIRTLTDENSLSTECGSDKAKAIVNWFNENCVWVRQDNINRDTHVPFTTNSNIAGFDVKDGRVYETLSNVYGFNGRGLLTDHIMSSMTEHLKGYFEEDHANVEYGDTNTFIEFMTDGTSHGTKLYSIELLTVLEATRVAD